jgi:adenylate cyclase
VSLKERELNVNGKTVLIVDDERAIRNFVASVVLSAGFEPLVAANVESAVRIMHSVPIDLFLLDVDLDGTSGLSLCRMIRKEERVAPVIFVTGTDTSATEAFAAGCDDLVPKPIEPAVLLARMRGHAQRTEYAKQLKRTHEMLEHYVSRRTREVVERAASGGTIPPTSQREVTVMFTDVRGFTALSEVMEPDSLFTLLSSQLAAQVHFVHEFGGYVDKFGGDGLMAVFDSEDMAAQACRCALKIMENAREGSGRDEGLRKLGIGINKGRAIIGNIGSQEHCDYSVIGTTVNLAARLCGFASPMTIVVAKTVQDSAATDSFFDFGDNRQVTIRGIQEPVAVSTLVQRKSAAA